MLSGNEGLKALRTVFTEVSGPGNKLEICRARFIYLSIPLTSCTMSEDEVEGFLFGCIRMDNLS